MRGTGRARVACPCEPGAGVSAGVRSVTVSLGDRREIKGRIVGTDPPRLRLDDIDDDEVPRTAPSLLTGGPPWLRLPEPEPPAPPGATTGGAAAVPPQRDVSRTDEAPRPPSPAGVSVASVCAAAIPALLWHHRTICIPWRSVISTAKHYG